MSALPDSSGKRTVLIADDDDTARNLLKSVLQAAGMHVVGDVADGKVTGCRQISA